MKHLSKFLSFTILFILFNLNSIIAQVVNGPSCSSYTNKSRTDGLSSWSAMDNWVKGVYVSDNKIYAATTGGLSISTNGGASFTNNEIRDIFGRTCSVNAVFVSGGKSYIATNFGLGISTDDGVTCSIFKNFFDGLGGEYVSGIYTSGNIVYAATNGGLSISTDGGANFTNTTSGLGSATTNGVYVSGNKVYVATDGGLSISSDGGTTFTNRTTANGLGDNQVWGVYASDNKVYVATDGGLSISTDGGTTFTNRTIANGLGNNTVCGVYAFGNTIYAATYGYGTYGGLSISTDGGATFTNYNTSNGLGSNIVTGVYATATSVYAATYFGLSFCSATATCTPTSSTETISACGSYVWHGTTYTTSGAKTWTGTNAAGCDSVVTLNLTINQATTSTTTQTATGSYSWNGNTYTSSGTYTWTGTNAGGCDSVATLNLTIVAANANGPSCSSYINKTTTDGLGANFVFGVFASGDTVYATTEEGLSISTNGGVSFTNRTTADGLGENLVFGVFASGNKVYAATFGGGLSISTDGGTSFISKTISDGLASNRLYGVYASGDNIYAATQSSGLSISTDGGASFTTRTTANGLGNNFINGVYVSGNTVYAATSNGLSISTDGGTSFTNYSTSAGLGNWQVNRVYASGSTVYAATNGGLSISTNGGATFTNRTTANGLGSNAVNGVYAIGSTVYTATSNGLSISTDGGVSFTNYKTTNGLGDNFLKGVSATDNKIYVATGGGLSFCLAPACTPNSSTETISACGSYVWHGTTYNSSNNTATFVTTNAGGCDSTVTLNLTINQPTSSSLSETACGSYAWHGTTYTTSGAKTWTGTNAAGCDSVVTLHLTINNATDSTETISACGSYTWHGTTYNSSNNTATWTGINAAGCDSVVTLNLTITTPTTNTTNETICGGSYTWSVNGQVYNSSGTYTSVSGCTTSVLNLTVINSLAQPEVINGDVNVCRYISTASIVEYSVSPVIGASSYVWYLSSPANMKIIDANGNEVSYNSATGYTGTNAVRIKFLSGFINIPNVQKYIIVKAKASCGISTGRWLYIVAQNPMIPSLVTATPYASICAAIIDPVGITQTAVPVTYKITKDVSATSYNWYVDPAQASNVVITHPNGTGINDTVISVSFYNAFSSCNLYVQSVNQCGTTSARIYSIVRSSPSMPGLISGPTSICANMSPNGTAAIYSVSSVTGVTQYNWTVPTNVIDLAGQGTRSVSFVYPTGYTTGTVSVTAQNGCGTSSARTLSTSRTVPGNPSSISVSLLTSCPDRSVKYSISTMPTGATSILWTYPANATSVTGQGTTRLTVTYPSSGSTGTVTAKSTNGCTIYSTASSSVSVKLSACLTFAREAATDNTATNAVAETMDVKVFPNPTTNSFNVLVGTAVPTTEKISLRLLDVQGRPIKSMMVMPNETINLGADLKSGAYLLEVKQGGVTKTTRVVKY